MSSSVPDELSFPTHHPFLITGLREGPKSRPSTPTLVSPQKPDKNSESARSERLLAIHTRTQKLESDLNDLNPRKESLVQTLASHPAIAPSLTKTKSKESNPHSHAHFHSKTTTTTYPSSSAPSSIHQLPSVKAHSDLKPPASASDGESEYDEGEVLAAARAVIKRHINLLHSYNEIKDVSQGLMGMVADSRGVRVKDVHDEYGVGEKDWR